MRSVGDRGDPGVSGNEEYLFALDQGGGAEKEEEDVEEEEEEEEGEAVAADATEANSSNGLRLVWGRWWL